MGTIVLSMQTVVMRLVLSEAVANHIILYIYAKYMCCFTVQSNVTGLEKYLQFSLIHAVNTNKSVQTEKLGN